jgi:RimJ/RimL family protein N-acetyltransferase
VSLVLQDDVLRLRPLAPSDVGERYLAWMRDPVVNRYLESRFHEHSLESLRAFVGALAPDPDHLFLAIVLRAGERHIGNVKLGPIDRRHGTADLGFLVGERDCWGKGYATRAIGLVCDHAFAVLGLRKVTAGAYHLNAGSIRALQKSGFTVEAVRRAQFLCDGAPVDHVLLGRLAPP